MEGDVSHGIESVEKSPKKNTNTRFFGVGNFTRMSQEVSKWLVGGLEPQYTPFISRL